MNFGKKNVLFSKDHSAWNNHNHKVLKQQLQKKTSENTSGSYDLQMFKISLKNVSSRKNTVKTNLKCHLALLTTATLKNKFLFGRIVCSVDATFAIPSCL
ncbi:UNVERIFIED_CONTAM: hypothetical protein K2H54_037967 [Gekko kuhli]